MNTRESLRKISKFLYFVLFFLYRLRFGFLAIVLGVAFVFVFRFWRQLVRDPNDLIVQESDSFHSVSLFYPDRITTGRETEIEFLVDALTAITETEEMTVTFSTDDDFAYFDPKVMHLTIPEDICTTGHQTVTMGYRNPLLPPESFNFDAVVSSVNKALPLNGNVQINSTSVRIGAEVTTYLTGIGALASGIGGVLELLLRLKRLLSDETTSTNDIDKDVDHS